MKAADLPSSAEIKYFLEVANALNISRASERLGISQPSLSLAIQRLEDAMGASLLVRSKSGVQLTLAGKRFVAQARTLLEEWDRLRSAVMEDEERVSGRFCIGCHPSVGMYTLTQFLPRLLDAYPGIEISLVHDLSRKVTESVISFKVDFGIVVNPVKHPDLVIKKLLDDEVGFWTGPERTAVNDLKSENAVLICDAELIQTQSLLKKAGKLDIKRRLTSSNLEVITSLVASGAGVGVLPERVATRLPELGLKKAGAGLPTFKDEICLVYRADAQRSAASKVTIDAIQSTFK
ncbi:MAG TPA: LysR family transcriptional regulator [Bdellovibrionales bacterium]|nr:LysR family transcriptional regulator [Bdellovibrionales bacterium]